MRFRLRTLLIVLALGPPLLAGAWRLWPKATEPKKQDSFAELVALIEATIRSDPWFDIGDGPGSIDVFSTQCFVFVEAEDDTVGPEPCGRSYSFRP